MSLRCTHIDAGLRIDTKGSYSPCCAAREIEYKDDNGQVMNVKTHTFEDAFNSPTLREIREAFKNNIKHPGCSDCWQEESQGKDSKRIRDNQKTKWVEVPKNKPLNLELNLGNICNLACRMCYLGSSMNWKKEFNLTKDPDDQWSQSKINFLAKEHNNSFTDDSIIWDELHRNMKYVKWIDTYGGEPMMMKKQWDALRYSVEKGYAKDQYIHFNTNGTIFREEYVEILKEFKEANISFSIDGTKNHFEYIRYPGKWSEAENIMDTWLEKTKNIPTIKFDLCFTFQILNLLNYVDTATWAKDRGIRIYRNAVYAPQYYNSTNIHESIKPIIIEKMRSTPVKYPEIKEEIEEIIRHVNFAPADNEAWEKFKRVNSSLDKSRNQSFSEMFPIESEILK